MKGCAYEFEIERFVLIDDAAPRVELDGWIISEAAIERVRLASDAVTLAVGVDAQADDSDRRLLLSLREPLAASGGADGRPGFADATVEIDVANGDRLAFGIGHLFRPPDWMPVVVSLADTGASGDADGLAAAIADGFDAFGDRDDLFMHRCGGRWVATSHRYGLAYALPLDPTSGRSEARDAAWPMLREHAAGLLQRLDNDTAMLVHRRTPDDTDDGMAALSAALRARNPDAALLWVDSRRETGPVARHRPGGIGTPEPHLLVAGAGLDPGTMLKEARDMLLAPR